MVLTLPLFLFGVQYANLGFCAPASNTRREREKKKTGQQTSQKSERFRDSPVTAITAEDGRRGGGVERKEARHEGRCL